MEDTSGMLQSSLRCLLARRGGRVGGRGRCASSYGGGVLPPPTQTRERANPNTTSSLAAHGDLNLNRRLPGLGVTAVVLGRGVGGREGVGGVEAVGLRVDKVLGWGQVGWGMRGVWRFVCVSVGCWDKCEQL